MNNYVSSPKYIKYLYIGLFVTLIAIIVAFGAVLRRDYRVYKTFVRGETRLQKEVTEEKEEFYTKKEYLTRLLKDPAFFSKVARQRLGYAAPNEIIYRFETDETVEEINNL